MQSDPLREEGEGLFQDLVWNYVKLEYLIKWRLPFLSNLCFWCLQWNVINNCCISDTLHSANTLPVSSPLSQSVLVMMSCWCQCLFFSQVWQELVMMLVSHLLETHHPRTISRYNVRFLLWQKFLKNKIKCT